MNESHKHRYQAASQAFAESLAQLQNTLDVDLGGIEDLEQDLSTDLLSDRSSLDSNSEGSPHPDRDFKAKAEADRDL